jgi:hypothetical protein
MKLNYVNINDGIQYIMVQGGYKKHKRGYYSTKGEEERRHMGK